MEKWIYLKDRADILKLSEGLNLPPFIIKILTNRGHLTSDEIEEFLQNRGGELNDPSFLPDVDLATDILLDTLNTNGKVRIVGDYDADGVMSTAILYFALKRLGFNPTYRLPDRFEDGYGLSMDMVREAKDDGIDLIITCDNGISGYEEIEAAKSLGINVIVTDHHDIPKNPDYPDIEIIPPADAIIDPKLSDSSYPFLELCGAGVCYQWMSFVFKEADIYDEEFKKLLQFAAIATVCDVMPLSGDNRKIVYQGLKYLNNTENSGLKALIEITGLKDKEIDTETIGYRIGPMINAAGRMSSPDIALKLIIGEGNKDELAEELLTLNKERQSETEKGLRRAVKLIESELSDDPFIVVYEPEIYEGVSGNIAGRLKEKYNRPVIVLTDGKDGAKASGRSIDSVHITESLTPFKDLFQTFGGHGGACGFSIEKENIAILRDKLNQNYSLEDLDTSKIYNVDYKMPLEMLDMNIMKFLKEAEPYGTGNREPVFTDLKVKTPKISIVGKNGNVLRFNFLTEHNREMVGVLFSGAEDFLNELEDRYGEDYIYSMGTGRAKPIFLDILYSPMINEFNGRKSIQTRIISLRISK